MLRHLTVAFLLQVDTRRFPLTALVRFLLSHLRRDCESCSGNLDRFAQQALRRGRNPAEPLAFRVDRLGLADLRRVRPDLDRETDEVLAALRELPADRRLAALRAGTRRRVNPFLAVRLIDEARAALRQGPGQTFRWLELAEEACAWLKVSGLTSTDLADLLIRLHAERGNALRVSGELHGAGACFAQLAADPLLAEVVDVRLRADLLSLEASLRQDQRRFGEADRLLARAERRYRRLEDIEGVGKVLIQRGNVADLQDRSRDAARLYRQAAEVLGREAFPRQHLAAQHNLALALCNLGEPEAAAAILAENRPHYLAAGDAEAAGLLAWIEGRIAWGLGDPEKAAARLLEARNGYVSRRQGYSAALVTLDLAAVHLERGRPREVKPLAEQMVPIFQAQDVHRELIAALMLFQQAARAEQLTAELLTRLRRYLLLARNDPRFRFEEGDANATAPAPQPVVLGSKRRGKRND